MSLAVSRLVNWGGSFYLYLFGFEYMLIIMIDTLMKT